MHTQSTASIKKIFKEEEKGETKNERITKNNGTLHFVLDIDDTLARCLENKSIDDLVKTRPYLAWFINRNLIIDAVHPHLLHPGSIEFIQFLFQIPNVRISFFSSGSEERNSQFVENFLKRAFPSHYDSLKYLVKIFSKENLVYPKDKGQEHLFGQYKKDLNVVLRPDDSLDRTFLIDDDPSYIAVGQEKNLLFSCCSSSFDMPDLNEETCYQANHLFYMTGLLKAMLSQDTLKPIDYLYLMHPQTQKKLTYYPNPQFFLDGLKELKKFNKDLDFYCQNPKSILNFIIHRAAEAKKVDLMLKQSDFETHTKFEDVSNKMQLS